MTTKTIVRKRLEDVAAQVLILDYISELLLDERRVDFDAAFLHVRCVEGNFLKNFFENGVQAARADVFRLLVDERGEARDGGHTVLAEIHFQTFGVEQRNVLLDEGVFRLRENANEIGLGKRTQLDANRKASLQFRNQIRRLGSVERAGSDEQN